MRPAVVDNKKKESARQKVYVAIRTAILSGKLKIGQRIGEVALAEEYDVSRAIIREALQRLSYEGLVEQNGYKGTRVVYLTAEQIDEITSARLALELEVIRQARQRLTEFDKEELRSMARKLDALTWSAQQYAELDLALHERLWSLSGNHTLQKLLHQITAPLFALGTLNRHSRLFARNRIVGDAERSRHLDLVEAICEGTFADAADTLRSHIYFNWPAVRRSFAEYLDAVGRKRPALSAETATP